MSCEVTAHEAGKVVDHAADEGRGPWRHVVTVTVRGGLEAGDHGDLRETSVPCRGFIRTYPPGYRSIPAHERFERGRDGVSSSLSCGHKTRPCGELVGDIPSCLAG